MSTVTLTLTTDEIDAVLLGLRLVTRQGDEAFADASEEAMAKLLAVLPPEPVAAPRHQRIGTAEKGFAPIIRNAMVRQEALEMRYVDRKGAESRRVVCPVALDALADDGVMAAWCERRADFRHFRLDRIRALEPAGRRYPRPHRLLLAEWRALEASDDGY